MYVNIRWSEVVAFHSAEQAYRLHSSFVVFYFVFVFLTVLRRDVGGQFFFSPLLKRAEDF